MTTDRRRFLATSAAAFGAAPLSSCSDRDGEDDDSPEPSWSLSLAQWSLHRSLRGGEMDNLDLPGFTRDTFDIDAVEWVNQFFHIEDSKFGIQPKPQSYLQQMKQRCEDNGVRSLLIMCDRVGDLGDPETAARAAAVEGHFAWLDAAAFLGCHGIRVNAGSDPELSPERQADLCADGLHRLCERAAPMDLNVLVENHGGLSSNGAWLARVIDSVGLDNCGTLPDFGNFYVLRKRGDPELYEKRKAVYAGDPAYREDETGLAYDRYEGVAELMPWAKGVSAKAHAFDEQGDEVHTDFARMMGIVKEAGYTGPIGIEYTGDEIGEVEGIEKTKALLERVFAVV